MYARVLELELVCALIPAQTTVLRWRPAFGELSKSIELLEGCQLLFLLVLLAEQATFAAHSKTS